MKLVIEQSDIKAGAFIINTEVSESDPNGFAKTRVYKIGWHSPSQGGYCLISALTDGMIIGNYTKEELFDHCVKEEFRILTHAELCTIINGHIPFQGTSY